MKFSLGKGGTIYYFVHVSTLRDIFHLCRNVSGVYVLLCIFVYFFVPVFVCILLWKRFFVLCFHSIFLVCNLKHICWEYCFSGPHCSPCRQLCLCVWLIKLIVGVPWHYFCIFLFFWWNAVKVDIGYFRHYYSGVVHIIIDKYSHMVSIFYYPYCYMSRACCCVLCFKAWDSSWVVGVSEMLLNMFLQYIQCDVNYSYIFSEFVTRYCFCVCYFLDFLIKNLDLIFCHYLLYPFLALFHEL